MDLKKILKYFLIAAAVIAVVCIAVYFLTRGGNQQENQAGQTGTLPAANVNGGAFNQNASGTTQGGGASANQNPSSATTHRLAIPSSEPVLDYFIDSGGAETIIEPNGEIASVTNNNTDILSSSEVQNVISAGFSYDGAKILINFGDASNPQTSVFDVKTKLWTPLPAGMVSPQWSPTDYRIAYLQNNTDGTKTLTTLDESKTKNNSAAVITLHIQDFSLLWLSKNKILFYDSPSVYTFGSAWMFDLQKKNMTSIVVKQRGMETAWSNAANAIGIVFTGNASQYGGQLQLVDDSGNEIEQFGFLTFPSKCVFNQSASSGTQSVNQTATTTAASSSTASAAASSSYQMLYCGVPRDQSALSSSKLPDDYEQMAIFTSDNIYRIDTSNGNVDTLFNDQGQNIDASDLKIFNNSLFFINRYDQKLYSINM